MSNPQSRNEKTLVYEGSQKMCPRLRWSRNRVFSLLDQLPDAAIRITDAAGEALLGTRSDKEERPIEIKVHDLHFYPAMIIGGSMAAGEGYMGGRWSCSDLTGLMRIVARNQEVLADMESGLARLTQALHNARHWLRSNTMRGSKKNIGTHYDLSNEFFQLFLDPTMTYSAGIFENENSTLQEASVAKLDRLCRKLRLGPDDQVLEIGTGWGSFAMHAAMNYGCKVTTTTISEEQYALAKSRVEAAGLSSRITLLKQDYRALSGIYDKLVSIEMIEAVGHAFVPEFFKKCDNLLKPGGRMAIQAITMADQEYDRYRKNADFINRYIFPGGCLPSITSMCNAMTKSSTLRMVELDDITPHYAKTLAEWRTRFMENLPSVRALGFSQKFIRMWEYYLCYCEGGFRERSIGTVHMVLSKP
jgi:cyclopropane-fatty-acyl-phospholipid synthase